MFIANFKFEEKMTLTEIHLIQRCILAQRHQHILWKTEPSKSKQPYIAHVHNKAAHLEAKRVADAQDSGAWSDTTGNCQCCGKNGKPRAHESPQLHARHTDLLAYKRRFSLGATHIAANEVLWYDISDQRSQSLSTWPTSLSASAPTPHMRRRL